MKKWLPWMVAGLAALWVVSDLRPASEPGFHVREFGRLPVLLSGRLQPLDSVARNALLNIRTRQTVPRDGGGRLSAAEWLMEVSFKPEVADARKVFRIDHPEVMDLLKVPHDGKTFYFSYNELQPGFEKLEQEAARVDGVAPARRTSFEKQVLKLHQALNLYLRLQQSLRPLDATDFTAELAEFQKAIGPGVIALRAREASQPFDQAAFDVLIRFLSRYNHLAGMAYPLAVPPQTPGGDWVNVGQALMDSARSDGRIPPAMQHYAAMATAYRQGQPAGFNQALADYRQWLSAQVPNALLKGEREAGFRRL
jgi:hypothetical protein